MEKVVNNNYRFERKIVVDSIKHEDLIYMFKSQGFNELFPERDICNLYLDDLNYHSLKDNILGNTKRLKHRIRWYGDLFGTIEKSVLEQKIKVGNVGFKNNFKISKKFYRSRKISNRILKMFFGVKFLKLIANFLLKISDKLKSVE